MHDGGACQSSNHTQDLEVQYFKSVKLIVFVQLILITTVIVQRYGKKVQRVYYNQQRNPRWLYSMQFSQHHYGNGTVSQRCILGLGTLILGPGDVIVDQ